MKIIKDNNLPIITTNCQVTPELKSFLTGVQGYIQDFIESDNSPLGSLSAELHTIAYHLGEESCTITIIFDITKCPYDDLEGINRAASEACTTEYDSLPWVLSNTFEFLPDDYKYIVTPQSLIFTASYVF